jgi:hypothetical protein
VKLELFLFDQFKLKGTKIWTHTFLPLYLFLFGDKYKPVEQNKKKLMQQAELFRLGLVYGALLHFQQYFCYIVVVSFYNILNNSGAVVVII